MFWLGLQATIYFSFFLVNPFCSSCFSSLLIVFVFACTCQVPVVLELASDLLDRRCPIFRDDT